MDQRNKSRTLGIFLLRSGETVARCVHPIADGSRPVSLAAKPDGLVVWGEYRGNRERGEIHIYGSPDRGETWQIVYTFAPGSVRHVHGLTYDQWNDCFWICTGDHNGEEQLLCADAEFRNVEVILKGGQQNRFYSTIATPDKLLMANDAPNADNFIRSLNKADRSIKNLARLDNSSFYSCVVDDWYFCSTNAERPETQCPRTYLTPKTVFNN